MIARHKTLIAALATFAIHGLVMAAAPAQGAAGNDVTAYRDVVYQMLPGYHPQTVDVYVPSGAGPHPAVIYAHGGGWGAGSPRMGDLVEMLTGLARRGYVAVGINYRFHGEAKFPAQIQDTKATIRWLRSNAAKYGVDGARIGIWGDSAGGYLAALAGTSCGAAALEPPAPPPARAGGAPGMAAVNSDPAQSDCVQAVVDWYGPIDFMTMDGQALPNSMAHAAPTSAESSLLGCVLPQCPKERLAQANPITYIDKTDPPFLIVHGDSDHAVPSGQSVEFDRALRAAGVASTLILVPGAEHVFAGLAEARKQEIWHTAYEFFDRTLGPSRRSKSTQR